MMKDLPFYDSSGETALWLGVLEQQVEDAGRYTKPTTDVPPTAPADHKRWVHRVSRYNTAMKARDSAREYLTTYSEGLDEVCLRAGVEVEYFIRKMKVLESFDWKRKKRL